MSVSDAETLNSRALAVFPGGTTRSLTAMFPLLPRAIYGRGYTLTGESGRSWIDVNNNFTALIHGHAHKAVTDAATEALQQGASFGLPSIAEVELAEVLVDRTPGAEQVRFCNSGTEAVMAAVRAARAATGKRTLIIPHPAYHGSSDAVLSAMGAEKLSGVPEGAYADTVTIPAGDADALAAAVARHSDDLAAVVLDVMPSRAGQRLVSPEFITSARSLTADLDAFLIVDEVISYRLHTAGMAVGHMGIEPDLLALGKIIGGGLPIGAVVGTRVAMERFDPRVDGFIHHGGTFSGNPVSMRAGLAALNALGDDEITRLNQLGDRLRASLRPAIEPLGWSVTGFGSLMKVVSINDQPPAGWEDDIWWAAEQRGLLFTPGTTLVSLSTPMDTDTIDRIGERLVDSLRAVTAGQGGRAAI